MTGTQDARMEEAQKCLYAAATLAHTHGKFRTAMKFEEARLGLIEYEAERAALAVMEQPSDAGAVSLFHQPSRRDK